LAERREGATRGNHKNPSAAAKRRRQSEIDRESPVTDKSTATEFENVYPRSLQIIVSFATIARPSLLPEGNGAFANPGSRPKGIKDRLQVISQALADRVQRHLIEANRGLTKTAGKPAHMHIDVFRSNQDRRGNARTGKSEFRRSS